MFSFCRLLVIVGVHRHKCLLIVSAPADDPSSKSVNRKIIAANASSVEMRRRIAIAL